MKFFQLKYGCNPNQSDASIFMEDGSELPIEILNGRPGYINFLDAFNSYQLVKELKEAVGLPAATSFKHVSPTSAAVAVNMDDVLKKACFVDDIEGLDDSPIATAYARARGTERMCSFGDFVALSDECDEVTARILKREVSDGIIAPSYSEEALEILKSKKKGNYNIIKIDPNYVPKEREIKQVYGISFVQNRNNYKVDDSCFEKIVTENKVLNEEAKRDLTVALICLKYTQSNSVAFAKDGQAIGIGAGQQSRIHCTRLAGEKADLWHLRQSPKVINLPFRTDIGRPERDNSIDIYLGKYPDDVLADGRWQEIFTEKPEQFTFEEQREYLDSIKDVSLASDAFFPFGDNIERAAKSGVKYVAEPGGSVRDDNVIEVCNKYNMVTVFTGMRLFHH
mgnify:FL=1